MIGPIESITLLPALVIILAASLVKSTAGFGFALVSLPLLLLFWEPLLVVPVLIPLVAVIDAMIVIHCRKHLDWRPVLPMVMAGALGVPIGNYILIALPQEALKFAIIGTVLVSAVLLLVGYTITIRRERLAGGIAGFFSGLLFTTTGLSGPPVALLMINQRWPRDSFRASQGLFHLMLGVLGIASLSVSDVLTVGTLLVGLALLPMVILGYALALVLLPHIHQQLFQRIVTIILATAAALAIGSELVRI